MITMETNVRMVRKITSATMESKVDVSTVLIDVVVLSSQTWRDASSSSRIVTYVRANIIGAPAGFERA
jgi:hypothetical protein